MRKSFMFSFILLFFFSIQISGQTWSSLKRLTWNSGGSRKPSIATDSGSRIHVVWYDLTPGKGEIFYKRSSDVGANWSGPTRLTWNVEGSYNPAIAADSGSGIHVVWEDYTPGNSEIFYKRSSDSGATWSRFYRLTWNAGYSWSPAIASDSGSGIHAVWTDGTPGNEEIFYKRSSNGGTTWSGLSRLTWNAGYSFNPSITTDSGSGIHMVWTDDTPGNEEIFYKRSSNGGTTWSGPTRLTWNAFSSANPSIATDSSSGIHVVWHDKTPGNEEIFYKRSSDGGTTWSGFTRLTWNAGLSYSPDIAADSGSGIHVAWRDVTPGNDEIFYKHSSDTGASWSSLKRLTWNSGGSHKQSIATDSSNGIHVVWQDNTPGNQEIFYKNRK